LKNLLVRSITGIIFIAVMLAGLFLGEFTYGILFLAIMLGMLHEFFNMTGSLSFKPNRLISFMTGALIFVLSFLIASERISPSWFFTIFPIVLITFLNELFANKKHPFQNIAVSLAAVAYAAIPISLSNYLVFSKFNGHYSARLFLALLIIIWVYDSWAYLIGVSFGKHRMFERISPKKSWEGAIGGTLVAVGAAGLISRFIPQIDLLHWLIMGFLIVVAATLGDLTESMIKRQFGVKDSGTIFPGHGGILDRFDSLLFAIPVFVCYLEVFI